jgi:hypothetical protein
MHSEIRSELQNWKGHSEEAIAHWPKRFLADLKEFEWKNSNM